MADEPTESGAVDEERLRRLLESPLDEPARRDREPKSPQPRAPRTKVAETTRSQAAFWAPLVVALVIGGFLTLGGFLLADDSGGEPIPEVLPTTTVTTPPTTVATHPFGALPEGYYALNDRVGARPERVLVRGDAIFVSFTTAVRSGLDPDETSGFTRGLWEAVLDDGRRITAEGEFTDPFARGTFTVWFPLDGVDAADLRTVELKGEALRTGTSHTSIVRIEDGLPWSGVPTQDRIPLEGDLTFVIDSMDLVTEGGRIDWHLEGGAEQQAAATVAIDLRAQGTFPAGEMFEHDPTSILDVFGGAIPPSELSRSGTMELVSERVARPSTVRTITTTWLIDWFSFIPAATSIPIDGIPTVSVG